MRIERIDSDSHDEVIRAEDPACGLLAFVAIHSTRLGPAAGGLRMRAYPDEAAALADALSLSAAMTAKNALAGLPLGGGKAVILGDPLRDKSPDLLRAFGAAVDSLAGRYWTAEDMGITPADLAIVAEATRHVAGLDSGTYASGDPAPVTARGVAQAVAALEAHIGPGMGGDGPSVAIQGLGAVGMRLARLLAGQGVRLSVADPDADRVALAVAEYGAQAVPVATIHAAAADIFAPCAAGGVLNAATIPELGARAIAGAANTQLATPQDAARLAERGILYVPDYLVNAGGIISVATEILQVADAAGFVDRHLARLAETLAILLDRAKADGATPLEIADRMVAERLAAGPPA